MLHTFTLAHTTRNKEMPVKYLLEKFLSKRNINSPFSVEIKESKFSYHLHITVDAIKLLNTFDIYEKDYNECENLTAIFIENFFKLKFKDFRLWRIDYRFDIKIENIIDRETFINLLNKKALQSYGYKKKNVVEDITIYYNSLSTKVLIYDKEKERLEKGIEPCEGERGIVRFEYAVMSKHLNYMKNQHQVEPTLKNYFTQKCFEKYIGNIAKIVKQGDFYKVAKAQKIIKSSNVPSQYKKLLIEFLIEVSKSSLTTTKQKIDNGASKFNKYNYDMILKHLKDLRINPILIPKNRKCSSCIYVTQNKY